MSDFNSLVQYTVENISRPVKYIIYKLTEFIRVVDKFVFRQVPAGAASGYATIEQIEGNTVVWNQLVQNGDFSDGTNGWSSIFSTSPIVSVTDGILKITKNANGGTGNWYANTTQPTYYSTHKYYIALDAWNEDGETSIGFAFYNANYGLGSNIAINVTSNTRRRYSVIGSPQTTGNKWTLRVGSSVTPMGKVGYFDNLVIHDLTAIFGAGNEPTTVADFEAWMEQNIGTLPYYDYNAGELISCKMESLKSVGFNQWDEIWTLGDIDSSGQVITGSRLVSSNYIPVMINTNYCFHQATIPTGSNIAPCWYDANQNFISGNTFVTNDSVITSPANARYAKFRMAVGYGTTYQNDICINISDPAKNGTYQPYMTDSADIDATTITGINPNTNTREIMFSSGMKQADREGTVKDTLDLRSDTATVNVGSRAYQSGDESDTSVITDGTTTYYALTTPIEYTDLQDANGNPINPRYKVEQGGTEQVLPVNTSTPTTVAPTLTTVYTKDVH